MKKYTLLLGILLSLSFFNTNECKAQSGDQILDGIGETDLIARYPLNKNIKDWTRNNLHGSIQGTSFEFTKEATFGSVLSLNENDDSFISIPAQWLKNQESMSITAWIYLKSTTNDPVIIDLGNNEQNHFSSILSNFNSKNILQTKLVTNGKLFTANAVIPDIDEWNHFAFVVDLPTKTLNTYINGELASKIEFLNDHIFDKTSNDEFKIYLGKSISDEPVSFNALLHDFRFYRIALQKEQLISIKNHLKNNSESTVVNETKQKSDLIQFSKSKPQLYNAFLTNVIDIEIETSLGVLPRLPSYLTAEYENNIDGPKVRVIWPAPSNNNQVLTPGTYTLTGIVPGTEFQPKALITVKAHKKETTPKQSLEPFQLNQVTLNKDLHGNDTKFIENRDKFINGLAHTNPDDFLFMFRNAFGQAQPEGAQPLGVWDSQETKLRGHATGHYLTALAQAYASTAYDPSLQANFSKKMEYMVNELYKLAQLSGKPKTDGSEFVADPTAVPPGVGKNNYDSDLSVEGIRNDYWNWGTGFISAYPPDQFILLESGAKYGTDNTKIWAPYYTLHKILAGLMDIYEISGNEKALNIVTGMGSWVHARLSQLPEDTLIRMWNTYIAGEYGGMNDAMARLYRLSNDPKYLEVAQLFDNIRVFFGDANHTHGLAKNVDLFRGLHANQHIPQIVGALETYRTSSAPEYYHIADNFWHMTTADYMYSIGGVAGATNPANAECFIAEPASLYQNGFSAGGQNETCATYNMLKLTRNLFLFNQEAELMDYYERGLYNHILASVEEHSPANTYHVPLRPGSVKHFSNADMHGFTCCNGTALESSTKLQNSIYFKSKNNKDLYVNLFVPSTLNWEEKNIKLTQATAFPKEEFTQLKIEGNAKFSLHVRIPNWANNEISIKINGKQEQLNTIAGSYLTINRKWKNGDIVEIKIPFQFRLEPVMDQQNIASLFYGPILLAAQEQKPLKQWRKINLNAQDISKTITGDPAQLKFQIDGVEFKPFYETYGRHSVYFDVTLE